LPQFDLEPATATCSAVKFGPAKFSGEAFGVVVPAPVHAGFDPVSHGVQTILLVEDEIFVRDVVGEILSCAGYRVLKARTAAEALCALHRQRERIHLLLTDVVLPDRNGCDLAAEFALLCRGLRTIFISGYPENAVTRKGFQRSEWSYLPKPFSGETLIQKVSEVLKDC
jgi:two-component system, cell cycle sensor histidine kinase and response regulator CckA